MRKMQIIRAGVLMFVVVITGVVDAALVPAVEVVIVGEANVLVQ